MFFVNLLAPVEGNMPFSHFIIVYPIYAINVANNPKIC